MTMLKSINQNVWMLLAALLMSMSLVACGNEDDESKLPEEGESGPTVGGTVAEAVDLGLSVKWASCNVGARVPEEIGGYYGWADPTGKNRSTDENEYPGPVPPSNISGTEYDIAYMQWGKNWHLPTGSEIDELIERCEWKAETVNGVHGRRVTGPNGNSIFLPYGGFREGSLIHSGRAETYYMAGVLYSDYVPGSSGYEKDCATICIDYSPSVRPGDRSIGHLVRPVFNGDKKEPTLTVGGEIAEPVDLGLSVKWASWNMGASSPEEYGEHFVWGDPFAKPGYDNNEISTPHIKEISGTEYDIARVQWGGSWRMPSNADQVELTSKCKWERSVLGNTVGVKVTGPNGNHIFLPAAGYISVLGLNSQGSTGYYWSGTRSDASGGGAFYPIYRFFTTDPSQKNWQWSYGNGHAGDYKIGLNNALSIRPVSD